MHADSKQTVVSPFDLVGAQLEVHVVSRCVACNGDFTFGISVCQLVFVCPRYDHKLPTLVLMTFSW